MTALDPTKSNGLERKTITLRAQTPARAKAYFSFTFLLTSTWTCITKEVFTDTEMKISAVVQSILVFLEL